MSCALREELLAIDRLDAENPEARALMAHASSCPDCRGALSLLTSVVPMLAELPGTLSGPERARLWSSIEQKRARPRGLLSRRSIGPAAVSAAVMAAIAAIVLVPWNRAARSPRLVHGDARLAGSAQALPLGRLPEREWLRIGAGAGIDLLGGGTLDVRQPSLLWIAEEEGLEAVWLSEGEIALVVDPLTSWPRLSVSTELARLESIAGRVGVKTTLAWTRLYVEEGTARIARRAEESEEPGPDAWRALASGEVWEAGAPPTTGAPVGPGKGEPASTGASEPAGSAASEPARSGAMLPGRVNEPPLLRREAVTATAGRGRSPPDPSPGGRPRGMIDEPPDGPPARETSPNPRGKERDEADIQRARSLLGKDDRRAIDLAKEVLDRRPDRGTEVLALSVAADANRRRGLLREADAYYEKVVAHPEGAGFQEEALYRRAAIALALGRPADALARLADARQRVAAGALQPERAALTAIALTRAGDPAAAAGVLESIGASPEPVLDRARIDVAQALLSTDPDRAGRLVAPLSARSGVLSKEAARIGARARERKQ